MKKLRPKTITCICGTRAHVGMHKRTCGNRQCSKNWQDMVQKSAQKKQTIKKHIKVLFSEPLKS